MNTDNYLFYLNVQGKVDAQYVQLAKALSFAGITVIPVSPKELISFLKKKSLTVIVINGDCQTNNFLLGTMGKILELAVKSGKINLFEFSSFKTILSQLPQSMRKRHVHSYLPLSHNEVVSKILVNLYNTEEREKLMEKFIYNLRREENLDNAE